MKAERGAIAKPKLFQNSNTLGTWEGAKNVAMLRFEIKEVVMLRFEKKGRGNLAFCSGTLTILRFEEKMIVQLH